eukprot:g20508.t1
MSCTLLLSTTRFIMAYDAMTYAHMKTFEAGPLPDHVSCSADGSVCASANEGEPVFKGTSYIANRSPDASGGVTLIRASNWSDVMTWESCTVSFSNLTNLDTAEEALRAAKVHKQQSFRSLSTDLEPEYIAWNPLDNDRAYVMLQEASTFVTIDVSAAAFSACTADAIFVDFRPLGWKDWSMGNNTMDPSDRDARANFKNQPVYSMYQPDTVYGFEVGGVSYIISANEGDTKDPNEYGKKWDDGDEKRSLSVNHDIKVEVLLVRAACTCLTTRVAELILGGRNNPAAGVTPAGVFLPGYWSPYNETTLRDNNNLGRMKCAWNEVPGWNSTAQANQYSALVGFGGRSFAIWKVTGATTELIYDSGGQLDMQAAASSSYDKGREDDKGTEPEGLAIGHVDGALLAFVGLERARQVAIYDISNPTQPVFHSMNEAPGGVSMDRPEGLIFVPEAHSPTGHPMLIASGEASNDVTWYNVLLDPCNATAEQACEDAHREACSQGSATCGACLAGFTEVAGVCAGFELLDPPASESFPQVPATASKYDLTVLPSVKCQSSQHESVLLILSCTRSCLPEQSWHICETIFEAKTAEVEHGYILEFLGTTPDLGASNAEFICASEMYEKIYLVSPADRAIRIFDLTASGLQAAGNITIPQTYAPKMLGPNSCYVKHGVLLVAVAFDGDAVVENGFIMAYDAMTYAHMKTFEAGPLPDHVSCSADGSVCASANEGEPVFKGTSYIANRSPDASGGVTLIRASNWSDVMTWESCTVSFSNLTNLDTAEEALRAAKVHKQQSFRSLSTDLEPEYIAWNPLDNDRAYVMLQEASTFVTIDVSAAAFSACTADAIFVDFRPLGWKDWSMGNNTMDPSDRDARANFKNQPVYSMYQPDTVYGFEVGGVSYIISANEGDTKDPNEYGKKWDDGDEKRSLSVNHDIKVEVLLVRAACTCLTTRVAELILGGRNNPAAGVTPAGVFLPGYWSPYNETTLRDNNNLGRMKCAWNEGWNSTAQANQYSALVGFGGRSFAIWKVTGATTELIYDSGGQLDMQAAASSSYDKGREDDKGTEPEGLAIGHVDGALLAFVGLERARQVAIYDISNPMQPVFHSMNEAPGGVSMDRPEGLIFVPEAHSPTGHPMLIASGEASNDVTWYNVRLLDPCNATAEQACEDAHRAACSQGSATCGACLAGFTEVAGVCLADACSSDVQVACANAHRRTCESGSTECGSCLPGYGEYEDSCVAVSSTATKLKAAKLKFCTTFTSFAAASIADDDDEDSPDVSSMIEAICKSLASNLGLKKEACEQRVSAVAKLTLCAATSSSRRVLLSNETVEIEVTVKAAEEGEVPAANMTDSILKGILTGAFNATWADPNADYLNLVCDDIYCGDVCNATVVAKCASKYRAPCTFGDTACGACMSGYTESNSTCEAIKKSSAAPPVKPPLSKGAVTGLIVGSLVIFGLACVGRYMLSGGSSSSGKKGVADEQAGVVTEVEVGPRSDQA